MHIPTGALKIDSSQVGNAKNFASGNQTLLRHSYSVIKGGLDHLLLKLEHIYVAVITFPSSSLSSVQILLIPACCLSCALSDDV